MKIGYARVSSTTQDLELQKQALVNAGCEKVFSESLSGKDNHRPELIKLIDSLREGDIVVVYKVDRIARSLKGLIEIIENLNAKQVHLVSLDSGDKVDTTSPMGKAFFQIAGVFAELERGMINARTKAGIDHAKKNGVKFGRTRGQQNKGTKEKLDKIRIFLDAGKTYSWIAKELSVSKKTIADVKKEKEEKKEKVKDQTTQKGDMASIKPIKNNIKTKTKKA